MVKRQLNHIDSSSSSDDDSHTEVIPLVPSIINNNNNNEDDMESEDQSISSSLWICCPSSSSASVHTNASSSSVAADNVTISSQPSGDWNTTESLRRNDGQITASTGERSGIDSRLFQRNLRHVTILELLDMSLDALMTLVERNDIIYSLMELERRGTNDSDWEAVVSEVVRVHRMMHSLSAALLIFVLDVLPSPSIETAVRFCHNLADTISGRQSIAERRNVCIVWAVMAGHLAGSSAIELLNDVILDSLISMVSVHGSSPPIVQLFAVLALEQFALTSECKQRIVAAGVVSEFVSLEAAVSSVVDTYPRHLRIISGTKGAEESDDCKRTPTDATTSNEYVAPSSEDCIRLELLFCLRWSLDNAFLSDAWVPSYKRTELSSVNVMLSCSDHTEFLKISADGLEARNDANTFESVRSTGCVAPCSDGFFYEVALRSAGVFQIGWATQSTEFFSDEGGGIGDDENSYAYDGCRQLVWHRGLSRSYGPQWRAGDIIGVMLDYEAATVEFVLNGEMLGVAFSISTSQSYYAAASFFAYQHAIFNFGSVPFAYPPPLRTNKIPYRSLNDVLTLNEEEKLVLPHIEALRRLREEEEARQPGRRCIICVDETPNSVLQPCSHSGFCSKCAHQMEQCPLCRVIITGRLKESNDEQPTSEAV